ncbi:hypothetical protein BJY04DRAFT_196596 [Aspergillus karnatakaensis]|uniref:uncharacterized protein n=1 Tax=Aspergillus karnatakaensis TaxID=1810916 RepID=UPI003CCD431B
MPGMWSGQSELLNSSSSLKKRKRDTLQGDAPQTTHSIKTIPSHFHDLDHSCRLEITDSLKYNHEHSLRLQNLARKRRALQQQSFCPSEYSIEPASAHRLPPGITYTRHSPSQIVQLPIDRGISSAPVSLLAKVSDQASRTSTSLLSPCHICHRKPTTKELLEAYADCDLCDQRACYICLRQCDAFDCCGPNQESHEQLTWANAVDSLPMDTDGDTLPTRRPRRICSCCAIEGLTETGSEVVRCLACIR